MLRKLIIFAVLITATRAMKCYQCNASVGDCIDGQCTGSWCTAVITEDKSAGTRKVEKACAQVNPANSGVDGCSKEVSGTITTQRCGCQLEDFCNSESGLTRLMQANPAGTAIGTGQQPTGGAPNGPINVGPNPNSNTPVLGPDGRPLPGQQFPSNLPPNNQPQPNQPPPGPQPFPGGPQTTGQNGQLPPPQIGPNNGQDFNGSSNNPQLPRFPPQGTPNNGQPEFGNNPNNPPNPGQNQPRPINGNGLPETRVEPEPTPRNGSWPSTTVGPNAINGAQALDDSQPRGDKYTCMCDGPSYCSNKKCKGDFCATIDFAGQDLARSPGQAPVSSQPIYHYGCMGTQGVPEGNTQRILQKVPYSFLMSGKRVTVNANEKFCAGNLCNENSSVKGQFSFSALLLTFIVLLFR